MKKALQILYGADGSGESQESQYLLHNTFCKQYAVTSDYSSLNYLGTNPLGSLELICFPTTETQVVISNYTKIPEACFNQILSYLDIKDHMEFRQAIKRDGRHQRYFKIDPNKLKSNVLQQRRNNEPQVKYVNMEGSDEENQLGHHDMNLSEDTVLDGSLGTTRRVVVGAALVLLLLVILLIVLLQEGG